MKLSFLLGVFVVYVFDGPRATRITISTVLGVSIMVPLIAVVLHFQMDIIGNASVGAIPLPSLRINTASVIATLLDLIFLAIAWEYLGKPSLNIQLWLLTLDFISKHILIILENRYKKINAFLCFTLEYEQVGIT